MIDGFPLLSASLKSSEYVVYTYAAITIEKILAVRNRSDPNKTMFEKSDIGPVAQDLLSNLFALILKGTTPEKLAENEFLMKCVTRVLVSSRESIVPYATVLLNQVISIVGEISKILPIHVSLIILLRLLVLLSNILHLLLVYQPLKVLSSHRSCKFLSKISRNLFLMFSKYWPSFFTFILIISR